MPSAALTTSCPSRLSVDAPHELRHAERAGDGGLGCAFVAHAGGEAERDRVERTPAPELLRGQRSRC